jgi:hypothetical protein
MSKETSQWIEHINFTFARLKSLFLFFFVLLFINNLFNYIFVLDVPRFFSNFLLPNPYGKYKLVGRKAIFGGGGWGNDTKSLVMKDGIKNGMMEMFVLFFFFFLFFFIIFYFFFFFFFIFFFFF